ncbi:hypothetical protein A2686_04680 [Candidatus Woesebacteria bacterium RIFCSPHIGHO2_01_FULL_38_10]|uniref:Orn/DAP/Arg decarboxylase 2 N-terminal domain-containing protein n=1 Tax=Candidatus Woesebacteria bacterium RIFCSPLOWO2_01_FULL_39_10b TaxID=1802517 RepID=A0A1F8B773_9BACT|nr:MAG: hypothetical protein A2686_04680 [Candidatus Woesebacteria bacterium RIFCSPHIGHO2_01_FULL_38_10]OGM59265.1 MAG: hypothetical protein A2892_05375 [Candidatus Woesebacteria bacterium RIFCSPLOWO2_01_FULL_39_10b]
MRNALTSKEAIKLVKKYGSPLFVTRQEAMLENIYNYFKYFKAYKGEFCLCYSAKTNPIVALLKIFREESVLAEVCSMLDIESSTLAGYKGGEIIFDGLVKTSEELDKAVKFGFRIINVETFDEVRQIENICQKHKKRANIGIRLTFPSLRVGLKSLLGISYDRFGLEADGAELKEILEFVQKSRYLKLIGVHCHTGSNQKSAKRYLVGIDALTDLMVKLKSEYGFEVEIINLGGGLGVENITAYKVTDIALNSLKSFLKLDINYKNTSLNFESLGKEIVDYLEKKLEEKGLKYPTLMLEPGRSLIGNTTDLISTVITRKETKHNNWLIIDAGTNLMPILTLYSEYHEVDVLTKNKEKKRTSIAGPLLYSSDIVLTNRMLKQGSSNDLVIIRNTGAYFSCQSNQFLQPRAATVLTKGRSSRVVQRRETVKDILVRDI